MNDIPRQKLREIIETYGDRAVDDPRLCRALLLDFCSQYRREIFVLVSAQEQKVANDLRNIPNSIPLSVRIAQLTQRLVDNLALAESAARWAVISWAYALGIESDELAPLDSQLSSEPEPEPEPAPPSDPDPQPARPEPQPQPAPAAPSRVPIPSATYKQGIFRSNVVVEVFGRPRTVPDSPWRNLGRTPDQVGVPPNYVLGLRILGVEGDDLATWLKNLRHNPDIVSLDLENKTRDAGLAALADLPNLSYLEISDAEKISDAGMAHIGKLHRLTTLKLDWASGITDTGLAYLRMLTNIKNLTITWSNLTDAGLAYLEPLLNLHSLALRECRYITGSGLTHLRLLPHLAILDLAGDAQLRDVGLRHISTLPSLVKLDLSRCTQITHQGLAHLRQLPKLTYLSLSRTKTDAAALKQLSEIESLIHLDLSRNELLTDWSLHHVNRFKKLMILDLSGCSRLSQRAIRRLQKNGLTVLT